MEDCMMGPMPVVRMDAIAVLRPNRRLIGGDETEELRDLARILNDEGVACLVINLGCVDWVNSNGLGAIVDAHQRFTKRGAHVHLACAAPRVMSLLQVTRLSQILDLYPTEEAAIADAHGHVARPTGT